MDVWKTLGNSGKHVQEELVCPKTARREEGDAHRYPTAIPSLRIDVPQ
jgi:hypothetical protein